jgi:NAD(P)-dependent dehydrogenase (short-subunit alcohol dehydrogenase family)
MRRHLDGKVCLVTGGTQGIGWAITLALADHGGQVFACGRSAESLAQAQAELQRLPWSNSVHLTRCDVTDRAGVERWMEQILDYSGRIDVLVNNAAFVRWDDVLNMSMDEAGLTMRVGYEGMVYTTKKVLPHMLALGWGHIINIGSITSRIYVGGASAAYSAAKAAVEAYTRTLYVELRQTPVNVTIVRLGTVAGTDFFKQYVPVKRMPPLTRYLPALTPDQVARSVVGIVGKRREVLNMPRYLSLLIYVFELAPRFARWLTWSGSGEHPDYAHVQWEYRGSDKQ